MTADVKDQILSDVLFARPSFAEGVGRIMDLSNSLNAYNDSRSGTEADLRALRRDWMAIGHDVRVALEELRAKDR
jgi:hypothetical protein